MQTLLEQEISRHPLFPNIKRKVAVRNITIQGEFEQIVIDACLLYYDENQGDKEVTPAFNSKLNGWIVNNSSLTTVRNDKGQPVVNPKYKEAPTGGEDTRTDEEREKFVRLPSFDYFFGIIKDPKSPSLISLLALHIRGNDQIKLFDKLLNLPIDEESI
nr:MAG TPA: hypothetical protein [Caudoviricetes sp.]